MIARTLLTVAVLAALTPASIAAQAHQTIADQREMQVDIRLRGFSRRILLDTLAVWTPVPQAPDVALADARRVIDSLKLAVTGADTLARVIYNTELVTHGSMLNERMSTFLRCGWGMTGEHADTWRVSLGYAVYVKPVAGGGSTLGVAIAASARDVEGAAKPPVQCSSTGAFEQRIAKAVAARGGGRD